MPFYEYECQACKYYAEVMQKMTDAHMQKLDAAARSKEKELLEIK